MVMSHSGSSPMNRMKIITAAAARVGALRLAQGGAEARIVCDGNYQIVNGLPVSHTLLPGHDPGARGPQLRLARLRPGNPLQRVHEGRSLPRHRLRQPRPGGLRAVPPYGGDGRFNR